MVIVDCTGDLVGGWFGLWTVDCTGGLVGGW